MSRHQRRRIAWVVGAWLSAHAVLIAGHVLMVLVYSVAIAPGLSNAEYQAFAMDSGPWFSIVAGGPVFYLWSRLLARLFPDTARSAALWMWALYSATDLAIVIATGADITALLVVQWCLSQGIKLAAVLLATSPRRVQITGSSVVVIGIGTVASIVALGWALPRDAPALVIRGVSVVDVERGSVVPARSVVIEDGLIVGMGPSETFASPDDATVVDGSGLYLSPGYADMHVHPWGQPSFDLFLAHGVTTIRDMNGDGFYLAARDQISVGFRRGPDLVVASRIMEGTPPPEQAEVIITEGRVIVDDSASAADSVRALAEEGFDAIKVYNNLNPSAYAGITAEAAVHGLPVVGHVPLPVGLEGVLDAGQRTIEHLRGYVSEAVPPSAPDQPGPDFRSRLVSWRHADSSRLRAWAERSAEAGVWNTPTLGVHEDLVPVDQIGRLTSRPGWQRCMPGRYADPVASRNRAPYFAVMSDADFAATQEGVVLQKILVGMLQQEGAGLLVGTDRMPWGFSFHWELAQLADAGLTPHEILRAATLSAAEYLGREAESGSIEVGKRADLVLLRGNPLDDIRNAGRIDAVIRNGVLFDSTQLEGMIDSACGQLAEVAETGPRS